MMTDGPCTYILYVDHSLTGDQIDACNKSSGTHPSLPDFYLRIFPFNNLSKAMDMLRQGDKELGKGAFDAIVVTLGTPGRSTSGYPVIEAADRLRMEARRFVVTEYSAMELQKTLDGCYKDSNGQNMEIGIDPPTVIMPVSGGWSGVVKAIAGALATNPGRPSLTLASNTRAAAARP